MPLTVTFNPAVYGGTPYGSGNKLCDVLSSIAFGPDTLVFPPGGGGLSVEG